MQQAEEAAAETEAKGGGGLHFVGEAGVVQRQFVDRLAQVLKFGGSSVASADTITRVLAIVEEAQASGPLVVVVSALGGTTDALLELGRVAAAGDAPHYRAALRQLETRHLAAVHS